MFPGFVIRLIGGDLDGGVEKSERLYTHCSSGVVDLVLSSCYADGLQRRLPAKWTSSLCVLVVWLLLQRATLGQLQRSQGASEVRSHWICLVEFEVSHGPLRRLLLWDDDLAPRSLSLASSDSDQLLVGRCVNNVFLTTMIFVGPEASFTHDATPTSAGAIRHRFAQGHVCNF